MNVGRIHGGTSINVIPAEAWLELDLRSEGRDELAKLVSDVEMLIESASMPKVDVEAQVIGERPAFLHLNDSQHPAGSNKDRHALLGEGTIGVAPFGWLLADARTEGIPLILETPSEREVVVEDDPSADPADRRMIVLLEGLRSG